MNNHGLSTFIVGTLTIELRGKQIDTCLSEFHSSSIRFSGVKVRDGKCSCTIRVQDFHMVYTICRKHKVKIRFLSRDGLPFLLRNSRRRKSFVIGVFLFVGILLFFSSMIWRVQVSGEDEDTTVAIEQSARAAGLYTGAFKWRLPSVERLSKDILNQTPNLIWVGVHLDGSTANIQAIKKIEGVKEEATTPQNIIAAKPAVIVKMFASRGRVEVKAGQFVQPGQVLISGDLSEGLTLVPARGQSIGEVWYVSKVQVPVSVSADGLTGEYVKREYLDWQGAKIRVWGWREPDFGVTIERESTTDWQLGGLVLPIQLKTVTEFQVQKRVATKTLQEVQADALKLASQDVMGQMGPEGKIIAQTVLHREVSHGTLYETVLTKTNEDIGVASPVELKPETDTFPNPNA